jgi:hypothetical protein
MSPGLMLFHWMLLLFFHAVVQDWPLPEEDTIEETYQLAA